MTENHEDHVINEVTGILIRELPWLSQHENLDVRDISMVLIDEGFIKVPTEEPEDEYATTIDAIRIHDEGDGWVIDGVDSTTGQYTATLLKYDTFEKAAQNVPKIIEELKADGVVFRTVS